MAQEIKIFEGTVANVKTTKRDGSPMVTSRGGAYIEAGFKNPDGSWLNLTAFDAAHFEALQPGNMVKVGYTEEPRLDGFGQPKLYNGAPQYYRNVTAVQVMGTGAPQTAQNALPTAQQGQGSPAAYSPSDRDESIRSQTTLKCAAEMYAAYLGANKALKWDFEEFERIYTGTHAILDGKNELDVALDAGKAAGMTEEPPVEMPGPDAPADEFEGVF